MFYGTNAIHSGGDNATGVTGTFAAGVEAAKLGVLKGVVAGYADRRGGAAFDCQDAGLGGVEAMHLLVELVQSLLQAGGDKGWQQLMDRAVDSGADIVGFIVVEAHCALAEIGESLDGRGNGVTDSLEDGLLNILLEMQKGQGAVLGILRHIGQVNSDSYAAIGIRGVALRIAHAVDHLLARSCCGRDNDSTRAHAEREDPVAVDLGSETVGGGRQKPHIKFRRMVLYLIDELLRVLYANTQSKGFGLEQPAVVVEKVVYVAGGMAGGQDSGDTSILVALAVPYTKHLCLSDILRNDEIGDPCCEMVFATVVLDGVTDIGYYSAQLVGANMGVGVDGNGGVGAMFNKTFQHVLDIAALVAAGVEFSVRVGACTPFPETPVAVGVHLLGASQLCDVVAAGVDRMTPFDDDGFQAKLQATQGSEEACRASTDNNDLRAVVAVLIVAGIVGTGELLTDIDVHGSVVENASPSGIEAATENLHMSYVGW